MIHQLIDLWLRRLAQPGGNPSAVGGHLLRLPLFPRNARGESVDGIGDCFSYADPDLHAAEFGGDRMDHPEFLGLPRDRVGGDFSAGAATWLGCAWADIQFSHSRARDEKPFMIWQKR